jgi:predicted metal-dependent HD superfamily phosphohydrolase
LLAAWSEPQRAYHTLQHLEECLCLLDDSAGEQPALLEMAFWFHDAVYDPKVGDNEERSADLAALALSDLGASAVTIERVRRLIMLTKTHQPSDDADEALLIDIDLAILGQSVERFDEYEAQIRFEYSWVPEEVYREKRAEVLCGFLNRDQIFVTEPMRQRFERSAMDNLVRIIARLVGPL